MKMHVLKKNLTYCVATMTCLPRGFSSTNFPSKCLAKPARTTKRRGKTIISPSNNPTIIARNPVCPSLLGSTGQSGYKLRTSLDVVPVPLRVGVVPCLFFRYLDKQKRSAASTSRPARTHPMITTAFSPLVRDELLSFALRFGTKVGAEVSVVAGRND